MRLFISIDLPDALSAAVADLQERFRGAEGLRFVDPEQVHVTLKFLGDTSEGRLDAVQEAVETAIDDAGVGPFEATLGGLGVFPNTEYISVIWVGVRRGTDEMTRLHEAIERETTALGFEAEAHDFTPHLTIARMDDARGKQHVQDVVRTDDPTLGEFRVERVQLKESTLTSDGPEYSTVMRFGL